MKKVYLLLRDNVQTGPYSESELLKKGLRPSDLIWIEGESHAWSYPNEIKALSDAAGSTNGAIPTQSAMERAGSSNPGRKDEIEERAEEIRKKVLSYHSVYPSFRWKQEEDEGHHPAYYYKENIDLVYHKKKRRFRLPVSELVAGTAVAAMLTAVWYKGADLFPAQQPAAVAATQMITTTQHQAQASRLVEVPDTARPAPITDTVTLAALPVKKVRKASGGTVNDSQDLAAVSIPVETGHATLGSPGETDVKKLEPPVVAEEKKSDEKKGEEKKPEVQEVKKDAAPAASEAPQTEEKKKTLGDVFKGIFKKKKKDADKEAEKERPKEGGKR